VWGGGERAKGRGGREEQMKGVGAGGEREGGEGYREGREN